MKVWIIRKDTYKIKDLLKADKCRWNALKKCWVFPSESVAKKYKNAEYTDLDGVETAPIKIVKHYAPQGKKYLKLVIVKILQGRGIEIIHALDIEENIYYMFRVKTSRRFGEGQIIEVNARITSNGKQVRCLENIEVEFE